MKTEYEANEEQATYAESERRYGLDPKKRWDQSDLDRASELQTAFEYGAEWEHERHAADFALLKDAQRIIGELVRGSVPDDERLLPHLEAVKEDFE